MGQGRVVLGRAPFDARLAAAEVWKLDEGERVDRE